MSCDNCFGKFDGVVSRIAYEWMMNGDNGDFWESDGEGEWVNRYDGPYNWTPQEFREFRDEGIGVVDCSHDSKPIPFPTSEEHFVIDGVCHNDTNLRDALEAMADPKVAAIILQGDNNGFIYGEIIEDKDELERRWALVEKSFADVESEDDWEQGGEG